MTTSFHRLQIALALTACLAASAATVPQPARAAAGSLLTGVELPALDGQAGFAGELSGRGVQRARHVTVDFRLLRAQGARQMLREPSITLELFPDVTLFAQFVRYDPAPRGMTWVGRVEDVPQSSVTLAYGGDRLTGTVILPNAAYHIRPVSSDQGVASAPGALPLHVVTQVDQSALPREAAPVEVHLAPAQLAAADTPLGDSGDEIDVLVLYTALAAAHAGGEAGITNLINLGMSETNTSYANSGISQRLRLVHAAPVAYLESSSFSTNLADLRAGNGGLSRVASLRDAYGADLVTMLVHPSAPSACGIAFIMMQVSQAFAASAFSVTDTNCVSPNFTFAHELGHNMGARHDWYVDNGTAPLPYAHGYVNPAPGERWRTVMAYPDMCLALGFSCTRILYWANPERRYLPFCDAGRFNCGQLRFWHYPGAPMGIPAGTSTGCPMRDPANVSCDADDHRALNSTALTIANFRQKVVDR